MDYEKKYNEALVWMRGLYPGLHGATKEDAEHYFPELRESEDERIRKEIIDFLETIPASELKRIPRPISEWFSWLEKQKEQKSAKKDNDFVIYHPLKCSGEYECVPYSFCGSLTSFSENKDLVDFLRTCFYTEEECEEWIKKQKEPKDLSESDAYALLSKKGFVILERDAYDELCDVEHIQQSWYMEGYKDCEHNREPMWIVKTSEDGPKYEPNLRYGQMLAEQKHTWNEEEKHINLILRVLDAQWRCDGATGKKFNPYQDEIAWLKSRRPSWKPSKEQMNCLCAAVDAAIRKHNESVSGYRPARVLKSLYEDLNKLM